MYDPDILDVQMKIKNRLIAKFWKELTAEYDEDITLTDGTFEGGYGECQKTRRTVILEQRCENGEYEGR